FLGTIRPARVQKEPRPVLTVNDAAVDRRTIGMHVKDRQKNSDAAGLALQHFVFINLYYVHHRAIPTTDHYISIRGRPSFGITEERDRTQKEQHKKPECPCREQPKNDREQRKKTQNPACFPEGLEAHKTSPFWEPENGWSRR